MAGAGRGRWRAKLTALLLVGAGSPHAALAETTPHRAVIFPGRYSGVELSPARKQALQKLLAKDLDRTAWTSAEPLAAAPRALKAKGRIACNNDGCYRDIASSLKADAAVVPSVVRLGGGCMVLFTVYDAKSPKADQNFSAESQCEAKAITEAWQKASQDLLRALKPVAPPRPPPKKAAPKKETRAPSPKPPPAAEEKDSTAPPAEKASADLPEKTTYGTKTPPRRGMAFGFALGFIHSTDAGTAARGPLLETELGMRLGLSAHFALQPELALSLVNHGRGASPGVLAGVSGIVPRQGFEFLFGLRGGVRRDTEVAAVTRGTVGMHILRGGTWSTAGLVGIERRWSTRTPVTFAFVAVGLFRTQR